jgi:hypothetical protein
MPAVKCPLHSPSPYFSADLWIFPFKDDVTVILLLGVSLMGADGELGSKQTYSTELRKRRRLELHCKKRLAVSRPQPMIPGQVEFGK